MPGTLEPAAPAIPPPEEVFGADHPNDRCFPTRCHDGVAHPEVAPADTTSNPLAVSDLQHRTPGVSKGLK